MIEYWVNRFLLSPFVPCALLLGTVASLVGSADLGDFLDNCRYLSLIALLTLALLRLWDDLADRERDRRTHPDRVLCNSEPLPFIVTAVALAIASASLAFSVGYGRLAQQLLVFYATVGGYYLLRPRERTATTDAVLLLKYPSLLFVLAPAPTNAMGLATAMLAIYGIALAYEIWHDAASPLRINLS